MTVKVQAVYTVPACADPEGNGSPYPTHSYPPKVTTGHYFLRFSGSDQPQDAFGPLQ